MKDWKLIFNTKNYHYILVKEMIKENYLKFYWKHQKEIEQINSFFFIMPTKEDVENDAKDNYVMRFGPLLKSFMDNPEKRTLFIEEDILKAIVKEDRLSNVFRLISKNNKNIVLFLYNDIDKYAHSTDFSLVEMTENDLELQYHLFDRFGDIKTAIKNTHNPFKDPISAFNKIQNDNDDIKL